MTPNTFEARIGPLISADGPAQPGGPESIPALEPPPPALGELAPGSHHCAKHDQKRQPPKQANGYGYAGSA